MTDLDPVRLRLMKLVHARVPPTDLKNASLAIERNPTYLHQFLYKGTPKRLPEDARHALAEFLGCAEAELRHDGPPERRGRPSADAPTNPATLGNADMVSVPEVDVRASAGPGAIIDGEARNVATWYFAGALIRHELKASPRDLRIITLEGDSMEPMLPSGSRIMIDTSRRIPTPPGIFVVWDGFGLVTKRLAHVPNSEPPRVVLKSINPAYDSYERNADEVNVVGRVVWTAQRV